MLITDSTSIITRDKIQILQIDNPLATAEISLFGGHILSFTPKHDNRERLWVSDKAIFDGKKAIRGGVPICWPWFGDHKTDKNVAAHGYVRTQTWEIVNTQEKSSDTIVCLQPSTCEGAGFTGQAVTQLVITVGKTLSIQLQTTNTGTTSFHYTCALHSYFAISNIQTCELTGVSGQYSDKTRKHEIFDTPTPYTFNEETDRVHLVQPKTVNIIDPQFNTKITSSGHDSLVVWNPWQDKSISMQDMADNSFETMLCVESAITQGQEVKVGETHVLEQIIF